MMILYWMLAATGADPALTQAQMAYMDCLSSESDAAVRQRVTPERFAEVASGLCEDETRAYRALTAKRAAGSAFANADAENRVQLVAAYKNRMRARRSRMAPPPQPIAAVEPTAAIPVSYSLSTQ